MLRKRKNPKTDKMEWALVSHEGRVLEYFGTKKPSDERFKKSERRVKAFKHMRGK